MNRQEDYDEIKRLFTQFIHAWESGNTEEMDMCVSADVYARFSMFGEGCLSRQSLKLQLGAYSQAPDYKKFKVHNFVCLIEGNRAQQSAGLSGVFTDRNGQERYWFTGMFTVSYIKNAAGWRMAQIHFELLNDNTVDMKRDSGGRISIVPTKQSPFVKNWISINDRIGWFHKCPLPVVSGEYDAPWFVIENRENVGTDEEQIRELFYRYCFGLDMNVFLLWDEIFLPDSVVNFKMFGPMNKRRATDVMKLMREEAHFI